MILRIIVHVTKERAKRSFAPKLVNTVKTSKEPSLLYQPLEIQNFYARTDIDALYRFAEQRDGTGNKSVRSAIHRN